MTETARVLLTAVILTGVGLAIFFLRLSRPDRAGHEYLVDQLLFSQWAGLLLAGVGAAGIGLAVASATAPGAFREASVGILTMAAGVVVLRREPSEALLVAGTIFLLHAAFAWAHRPGVLVSDFVPRWWTMGTTLFDVYVGTLCLLTRRAGPR